MRKFHKGLGKHHSYVTMNGYKIPMPKLYKQRLYPDITRKVHALISQKEKDKYEDELIAKAEKKGIDYQTRMHEIAVGKTKILISKNKK